MDDTASTALALQAAISVACPQLRPVGLPNPGLFGKPVVAPELYPTSQKTRGYYVPIPPPPPFKLWARRTPVLVGESGGRQWIVHVHVLDLPNRQVLPSLEVVTFVRFQRSDLLPFPTLPWMVATGLPDPGPGPRPLSPGPINLAGMTARSALGEAVILAGRTPVPTARPPVQRPLILDAFDPAMRAFLESPPFLASYAAWERRAGGPTVRGGTALPVLKILGDSFKFVTGLDPSVGPQEHARSVADVLSLIPMMERAVVQRDAVADPIPRVTFTDPPGSVPDIRPAYACPKCGRPEILKLNFDRATGLVHKQTMNCGVDVFPPFPNRIQDVQAAASWVAPPPP